MAFLQEQDQTRIGVMTTRNEIGYAKVGCCILKYVGKYYEMPRILKIAGDGLEYAVKEFTGSDLNDNYDVTVVQGSTIPESKVLRRQNIINDFEMGLLGNPQDPMVRAKVNEMLEYGDDYEIWKKQALTQARIKRNILSIEQGEEPKLSEFDNHAMHLDAMDDYRLSDKYTNLDDKNKQLFDGVMEWHLQAMVTLSNPGIPQQQLMADQMIKSMNQNFAQQNAQLAQHPGAPGGLGGPPGSSMDVSGNPIAPAPTTMPVPNAAQLPNMGKGA
jgi:hypothetical protein